MTYHITTFLIGCTPNTPKCSITNFLDDRIPGTQYQNEVSRHPKQLRQDSNSYNHLVIEDLHLSILLAGGAQNCPYFRTVV